MPAIIKSVVQVENEINKSGELILKENRYEAIYFLGIKLHERDFRRKTDQSELTIAEDTEIGFKNK